MKKFIIAFGVCIALVSCKKEKALDFINAVEEKTMNENDVTLTSTDSSTIVPIETPIDSNDLFIPVDSSNVYPIDIPTDSSSIPNDVISPTDSTDFDFPIDSIEIDSIIPSDVIVEVQDSL